jgi:hypothetical protein
MQIFMDRFCQLYRQMDDSSISKLGNTKPEYDLQRILILIAG